MKEKQTERAPEMPDTSLKKEPFAEVPGDFTDDPTPKAQEMPKDTAPNRIRDAAHAPSHAGIRRETKDSPRKPSKKRTSGESVAFRVVPIILVALALFTGLSLLFPSLLGVLGGWVRSVLLGIFGCMAFMIPVSCFLTGIFFEKDYRNRTLLAKTATTLLFMIFASALFYTFGIPKEFYALEMNPAVAYASGSLLRGGGVLGNLLGYALVSLLSPIGAALLFAVIALLFLTVCFNLDLRKLGRRIARSFSAKAEKRRLEKSLRTEAESKKKEAEETARRESEARRKELEAEERRRAAEAEELRRRNAAFADAPTELHTGGRSKEADKTEKGRSRRNDSMRGRSSGDYPLDNDLFYTNPDKVAPLRPVKKEEGDNLDTSYLYLNRQRDAAIRSRQSDLSQDAPQTMEDFRRMTTTAPIRPPVQTQNHTMAVQRENVGDFTTGATGESNGTASYNHAPIISDNSALPPYEEPLQPVRSTASGSLFSQERPPVTPVSSYDSDPLPVDKADAPPFIPTGVTSAMRSPSSYMSSAPQKTAGADRGFTDNDSYTAEELAAGNARFQKETARPFGAPPSPTSGAYASRPVSYPTGGGAPSASSAPFSGGPSSMSEKIVYFPSQGRTGDDTPRRGFDFSSYRYPDPSFLLPQDRSNDASLNAEVNENMEKLIRTLDSFGVSVEPRSTTRGPRITRYEIVPSFGVRINAITNLQNEIAMNLRAKSLRIEAPIPGDSAVGIEVPNQDSPPVRLRSLIDSDEFRNARDKTLVALGADIAGKPIYAKISSMPHMLVAGATGMGKSVCINTIITSILYKARPDEVRLILVDPKMVEFNIYEGIPHLLVPVINDVKQAIGALNWAADEMNRRFSLISKAGARDLDSYAAIRERSRGEEMECLPRIVIIIDELNDLVLSLKNSKPLDDVICRIAQKARAAGIHLLIGTQRPTVNVITGNIKANIPSRIAFKVSQKNDSMTILDAVGAEKLLGAGDMLYLKNSITRIQGCLVETSEIDKVVSFLRANSDCDMYDESAMRGIERATSMAAEQDASKGDTPPAEGGGHVSPEERLFWDAVDIFLSSERASTSLLQRKLSIGYGRAAKLIDKMEELGIVSSGEDKKAREILMTHDDIQKMRASLVGRDIFDADDDEDAQGDY